MKEDAVIVEYLSKWLPETDSLRAALERFKEAEPLRYGRLLYDTGRWRQEHELDWVDVDWSKGLHYLMTKRTQNSSKELRESVEWLGQRYPLRKALFPKSKVRPVGYSNLQIFLKSYVNETIKGGLPLNVNLTVLAGNINRVNERQVYSAMGVIRDEVLFSSLWRPALSGSPDRLKEFIEQGVIGWETLTLRACSTWIKSEKASLKSEPLNIWIKECMPYLILNPQHFELLAWDFVFTDIERTTALPGKAKEWVQELVEFAKKGATECDLVAKHVNYLCESAGQEPLGGSRADRLRAELEAISITKHIEGTVNHVAVEKRGISVVGRL